MPPDRRRTRRRTSAPGEPEPGGGVKRGIARTASLRGARITGAGRGNKKQTNSLTAGSRVSEFSECVEFPDGFQRFRTVQSSSELFGVLR